MKSTVLARLETMEKKLKPKKMPKINLGLECNKLDELQAMVDRCKSHNNPASGLHQFVIWTGEPNAEAEAIAGEYAPDKYLRKTIIVKHAEVTA
jgi:hypothetical protein